MESKTSKSTEADVLAGEDFFLFFFISSTLYLFKIVRQGSGLIITFFGIVFILVFGRQVSLVLPRKSKLGEVSHPIDV